MSGHFHGKAYLKLHHLAGATIQAADLVNYGYLKLHDLASATMQAADLVNYTVNPLYNDHVCSSYL